MATGSVARIGTNAMRGGRYDDNGNNLRQLEVVFCGRNGNASKYYRPRIIGNFFFAHELHELTRIVAMDKWRPGRSHKLSLMQGRVDVWGMSCGVLPSRQNQCNRFLPRTSSPVTIASLCSAFQARFITLPFCPRITGRLYAFFYP